MGRCGCVYGCVRGVYVCGWISKIYVCMCVGVYVSVQMWICMCVGSRRCGYVGKRMCAWARGGGCMCVFMYMRAI